MRGEAGREREKGRSGREGSRKVEKEVGGEEWESLGRRQGGRGKEGGLEGQGKGLEQRQKQKEEI